MFWHLVQSEILKMRKTNIWLLLFVSPLLAFAVGLATTETMERTINEWTTTLLMMTPVHTILFLPLIIGVFTSFICRYEHKDGGWKQLLSLPVKRTQVYVSKFSLVMSLIALNQILFMLCWISVGLIKGFSDPFPTLVMFKSLVGGWIASLPLASIMLLVSMAWSSFAAPLALNVVFTLPNILVANSETYAPYYPWVQPFLTMIPKGDGPWGGFFVSFESIIFAIIGGFVIFFASGLVYIRRKAV
ncbi:ABC transporter permease [Metabacillus sp. FJAT-53654]|uniref:ABC transporter permease n=1 Tax=Metabacillus rhizosphaerae TaxID=3117747 RepID=A0ABZ2MWK4_9BACI